MRVLVLASDAFGARGGIPKFNRDFLRALLTHPACSEAVAIPRHMPNPAVDLPSGLVYVTSGLDGKLSYIAAVLRTVHRSPAFDLIICGHINLLPISFLLRLWVRAPIVLVIHGIEAWKPTNRLTVDYLIRGISAFISVSQLTKQRFLEWTKLDESKGFLLPNSIEQAHFSPGPKSKALIDRYGLVGKTVLMTLGEMSSYERHKGFDGVLEVLPILSKEIPNVVYLMAGDGPDRQRLERKTRSLGVERRVVFAGFVPEAEKVDHYRLADAYVMPSRGEGFGIVCLEALACGVPVVASKVDGSREAVRAGKLGILVDPGDREDVKAGVLKALGIPKGTVPVGLSYFSYSNFKRRLHHIVDKILAG